eukprot:comp23079_c0_seq1/m.37019 comp23079_c0_seq1/g.37019  ORF comp23079_c0_seq1/g.37019 comp23079_c0_seq1/m.37019 type:complete len:997 (-) comp23079_c0_seq1:368-3358(-)
MVATVEARQAQLRSSLGQIFNDAQDASRGPAFKKLLKQVWKLEKETDPEVFNAVFTEFVDRLLLEQKREPAVERMVAFVAQALITHEDYVQSKKEGQETVPMRSAAETILSHIAPLTKAKSKAVRFRACQLITLLLKTCTEVEGVGIELDEGLLSSLAGLMVERCRDKLPVVRAQALCALALLQPEQGWEDADGEITAAFIRMATVDSSAEVRRAALDNIALTHATLPCVLGRTRDVSERVRARAYDVMGPFLSFRRLARFKALHVLKDGLRDRHDKVRHACAEMCSGFFSATDTAAESLQALDVVTNTEIAEEVLKAIFGLKGEEAFCEIDRSVLTPESVLVWRVLVAHHLSLATPTSLQQVDRLLPPLTDLCEDIAKYKGLYDAASQETAQAEEYVVVQLLKLAAMGDMTDEVGKTNLCSVVMTLFADRSSGFIPAAMHCLVKIHPRDTDRVMLVTEIVSEMIDPPQVEGEAERPRGVHDGSLLRCLEIVGQLFGTTKGRSLSLRDGAVMGLVERLVLPGVQHAHPKVRGQALRCLGHCCLLDVTFARQYLLLLLQALDNDIPAIKKIALEILFDMVLVFGIEELGLDASEEKEGKGGEEEGQEEGGVARTYLPLLKKYLDSQSDELRTVAAEGFARLLINDRLTSAKVFASLVTLYFNPITEEDTQLRQCLTVFFEAYAFASHDHQLCIAEAFLPIIDTFLNAPKRSPLYQVDTKTVGLYLAHLTSFASLSPETVKSHQTSVHDDIAIRVCNRLLRRVGAEEQRLWLRVVSALCVDSQDTVKALRVLANGMDEVVADRQARKMLETYQSSLLKLDQSPEDSLTPKQLEEMRATTLKHLTGDPNALGAARVHKANRNQRLKNSGKRARSQESSSEDEDNFDLEPESPAKDGGNADAVVPPSTQRKSTRERKAAAPATTQVVEESDSDDVDLSEDSEGESEYEVEAILEGKKEKGKIFYLCKWKGFDDKPTWEPRSNVSHLDVLKEYEKEHGRPR